jgi:AcrR family transcriptional regulator
MARPQAPDYDRRRLAIVAAAAALFAREGFNGASVAQLAKRCRVSKALIYHYYPSKEDILYDVMASHVRALEAVAHKVAEQGGEAAHKLRELTRAFLALYVGAADRHKVLLNDLARLPRNRRAEIVAVQRRLIEIVRGMLVEVEPGLGAKRSESFAAAMLYFGMINWTHTWFQPGGPVSAARLADLAVDLVVSGIAAAARRR